MYTEFKARPFKKQKSSILLDSYLINFQPARPHCQGQKSWTEALVAVHLKSCSAKALMARPRL